MNATGTTVEIQWRSPFFATSVQILAANDATAQNPHCSKAWEGSTPSSLAIASSAKRVVPRASNRMTRV